ncbi:MAG: c-type cytochrome [Planctomycetota bacterium]
MTKRPSSIHNDPGYFYNRKLLLRIFTFSSLLFVVGITWWIWVDFDRAWKHDQKKELLWEADRFRLERLVLDNLAQADDAKYAKELAEAERKVEARTAEIAEIDGKLKDANGAFYLADMKYKEQKQYTSEAEYWVQEASSRAELADWWHKLRSYRDDEDRKRDAREMADANLQMLLDRKKAAQAEVDAVRTEMRKNPDLKRLEIVRQNIQKKKGYNPAREIPLLDFLAPPVKVKQIVLDNLVDNYEFSTPKKVDRCATCHILSSEVGYDAARWPIEAIGDPKNPKAFEDGVYRFVFAVFDGVDPDKPAVNAPFRRELDLIRKARLHALTLDFLFEMEDADAGEIKTEKDANGSVVKVWKKYLRDPKTGHWTVDPKGDSIAGYYRRALSTMKPHWRTHPHFKDMVGASSPHPFEKFGCSGCHQGRGWSTDFGFAYHSPDLTKVTDWMTDERAHEEGFHIPLSAGQTFRAAMAQGAPAESAGAGGSDVHVGWVTDEATGKRWEHELGATESKLHYWHWPQFPKTLVQSACLKCHKEGLYRTAEPEYEGVHIGKPVKAPDTTAYDDQSAALNTDLAKDPSRLLIPEEPPAYRPRELERGLDNFLRFGCYGCHKLDTGLFPFMKNVRPKVGPPLDELGTKTTKEWTLRWVRNPKDFRPETRMPRFFGLSNNSQNFRYRFSDDGNYDDVNGEAWADAEIQAIVEWIFDESTSRARKYPAVDLSKGDPKRGEQYVVADGLASDNRAKACIACHDIEVTTPDLKPNEALLGTSVDKASGRPTGWKERMSRRQAPNLGGIASKVTPEWLVAWLKNPRGYWHDTNMPDLRLTDQEALDIAAFLMTKKHVAFDALPGVPFDQSILDRIAEELRVGEQQESTEAAVAAVQRLTPRERTLYVGKKLFKHYGCFGCHQIDAYKDATPIGTELSDWGSKLIERLEFNHAPIEHTRFSFGYAKMMNPRIYDMGMPRADRPFDRLKMPRFGFRPEEARDLATFLVALVNDPVPLASLFRPDEREQDILRGREIVKRYNCQGCHVIENEGGDIWPVIANSKWRPPDLKGQGRKTQPQWLFSFLKDPAFIAIPGVQGSDKIRPWYSIRMPTFHFTDEEARALNRYFSALSRVPSDFETGEPDSLSEKPFPAPKRFEIPRPDNPAQMQAVEAKNNLEETRFMFQAYQCKSCHSKEAKVESAAPDFRLARGGRLRDTWIEDWLWGPLKLQPGTAMPVFFVDSKGNVRAQDTQFLGGSAEEQIRALRDFVRHHYREEDK